MNKNYMHTLKILENNFLLNYVKEDKLLKNLDWRFITLMDLKARKSGN